MFGSSRNPNLLITTENGFIMFSNCLPYSGSFTQNKETAGVLSFRGVAID